MNEHIIWTMWKIARANTAEIARELKLKECDVEQIIWVHMNEQYLERKKPFAERVKA